MIDTIEGVSSFLIMIGVFASIRAMTGADKARKWTDLGGSPTWKDYLQGVGCLAGIVGVVLFGVTLLLMSRS